MTDCIIPVTRGGDAGLQKPAIGHLVSLTDRTEPASDLGVRCRHVALRTIDIFILVKAEHPLRNLFLLGI